MPIRVKLDDLAVDTEYEKGLQIQVGINRETVGAKRLVLGHTIFPPGSKNLLHYHWNCESAVYIIRGHLAIYGRDRVETIVGPGQFYYNPQGEIHGQRNLSDTEEVEVVFAFGGVAGVAETGTVFVEA